MKIAVVLSGHPRSFRLVHRRLKQQYEAGVTVDYFCHVWNDSNGTHLSWNNRGEIKPSRSKVGEIISLLNPKVLVYKVQNPTLPNDLKESVALSNLRSMFSGICEGLRLVLKYSTETGEKYDLIIRGRYDLVLGRDLIKTELRKSMNECTMFLAGSETYHQLGGVSDVFFFAPPVVMKEILDIDGYILDTYKRQSKVGLNCIPEILFRKYLEHKNISIAKTELTCSIMRSSGKLQSINHELNAMQEWNSILLFNPVEACSPEARRIQDRILQESKKYLEKHGVQEANLIVEIISASNLNHHHSYNKFEEFKRVFDYANVFYRSKEILGRERVLSWLVRRVWLSSFRLNKFKSLACLFSNWFMILFFTEYLANVIYQRSLHFWRKVFGL